MRTVSPVSGRTVFCLLIPVVLGASPSFARQTTVTGTVGTVVDYRERSYEHGDSGAYSDDGDRQKIGIRPEVLIVSRDVRDSLSLHYSPTLSYDAVLEENEVDHQLDFQGERWLSHKWSVSVAETYIRSDDPGTPTRGRAYYDTVGEPDGGQATPDDTPTELSRDQNGRKYWTNTARVRTNYAVDKDSRIGGGYTYSVLRNDGDGTAYEDYDRHSFFSDLAHGFTPNWRSNLGLNYTRGLYDRAQRLGSASDDSPDLDQYGLLFGIDYVHTLHDFYPFKYSLNETQYDGDTRPDNQIHAWSLGWDHAFDSRTRMALGGGPSYAKIQGLEGSWGYNAYATLNRAYEHAALLLSLNKAYETKNFTGSSGDNGLTDTYSARAAFSYRYTQDLSFNLFGSYSRESTLDPQGIYRTSALGDATATGKTGDASYDRDIYETGIGCSYSFARWYKAGLKYSYYVSDGKLDSDQYTDHQVLFTLSASHELWRW